MPAGTDRCDPGQLPASPTLARSRRTADRLLLGRQQLRAGDRAAGTDRCDAGQRRRRSTRVRSRATAPRPAGATTTRGRRRVPLGSVGHRADQRRRRSHVRAQGRRYGDLLGRRRLGAGDRAARADGRHAGQPPAQPTRARSRATAPRPAGATTIYGQATVPPGLIGHRPDRRRRRPYVCAQGRRYRHLLGLRRRTGRRPCRPGCRASRRSAPASTTRARSSSTARRPAGASTARGRRPCRLGWQASPRSAPGARIRVRSRATAPSPVGATAATGRRPCRRD